MTETPARSSAADFYNNPLLSDVTIKQIFSNGQVREYHAHKFVLCTESQSFYKAFTGGFKEASENVINLHEEDPDHFESLLKFIYTKHYDDRALRGIATYKDDRELAVYMDIYSIANKYDVAVLLNHVLKDIEDTLTGETYIPDNHACLKTAIETHYSSPSGNSSAMGNMLAKVLREKQQEFTESDDFDSLIQKYPQLAVNLTMSQKRSGWLRVQAKSLHKEGRAFAYCQRCAQCYTIAEILLTD